jgi:acyl-coenzyme A thioesterase PaaI-like protein
MTDLTKTPPNRLERQLERLSEVPAFARTWFRSVILRRAVPFTGTAGLDFLQMSNNRVEIGIQNHKKVQNHIGGVHASAMNLLAETATGMVVGMNVRDDCVPLAKELKMTFRKRATGSLRAVATLTDEQRAAMQASDKGEVNVAVTVTDEAGVNPVECEFVWAWVPSVRSQPTPAPKEATA